MSENVSDDRVRYKPKPGSLIPVEEKLKEFGKVTGDEEIIKNSWEKVEEYATRFVWMCLTDI
jgi:hypothetical protein